MEVIDKTDILREITREKEFASIWGDEGTYGKYSELQKIVEQIDLSVVRRDHAKRRKTRRSNSDSNLSQFEKHRKELEETEKQIDLVKKALAIIYEMESTSFKKSISEHSDEPRNVVSKVPLNKRILDDGEAIPLWSGKENEPLPELCGAIQAGRNYVAEIGDIVAASIKQDKRENWILAEVLSYDPLKKEYVVNDIYDEPKKEQKISKKKMIPLPKMRANPKTHPEAFFPKDTLVLALYPQTTCFYPAIIGKLPTKPEDPYRLLFKDSSCKSGYSSPVPIHQRYVICYRGKQ